MVRILREDQLELKSDNDHRPTGFLFCSLYNFRKEVYTIAFNATACVLQ